MIEMELEPFDQQRYVAEIATGKPQVRDGRLLSKPNMLSDVCVNRDALATLLYSGTIYPPQTIFQDHTAIGMGGRLRIDQDSIHYESDANLFADGGGASDDVFDCIDLLAESIERSDLDVDNATLLLSEGKDSTGIALALAQLGRRVPCFTFANADSNVEYVEFLARKLGFPLTVFRYQQMAITEDALDRLGSVFEPTTDQAFLSFLLLPMERFQGQTLLDGMGNDLYMGHLPSANQYHAMRLCSRVEKIFPEGVRNRLRDMRSSDHPSSGVPFRSFTECQGLYNGLSESLISASTHGKVQKLTDLDRGWKSHGFERSRALSRGRFLDNYSYSGKSIALAEMADGRVYFPWADPGIAKRFLSTNDQDRFQWPTVNKLMLRNAIAKRIDYQQPKVGFKAPLAEILTCNRLLVERSIDSSRTIGGSLKTFLKGLRPTSPRLSCVFLYTLWEMAHNQRVSVSRA
ncbi:hypothetical protein Poly21_21740 [Allorhodopirellula heiligendammensis]|uniref:Uncharacterized protein n=2 Tax=Allorhodopirellula heiligendammensis TaxID=2714739 RepID=A0A5C6C7C0_9BACT|nr:hypothetical protein Poly21_21740 [Allorhodopirellula heiligendammensis]